MREAGFAYPIPFFRKRSKLGSVLPALLQALFTWIQWFFGEHWGKTTQKPSS